MRYRILVFLLTGWLSMGTVAAAPAILVLGDSLSAAYGFDQHQGWVSLLARRLADEGFPQRVVNTSISGETSRGGLSRLPAALARHKPGIVILELGANDGLRGLPLAEMRENLEQIIRQTQAHGARLLLIGMRLPPNYGPRYTQGFQDIYLQLAEKYRLPVVPFLLQGVSERRELMQPDNLHPTAAGQPLLLETVWPQLLPLLAEQPPAR